VKPEIKIVETKKDLKAFVKVPFHLYKGHPYWVPQMIADDMELFNQDKNPAYDNAESRLFIAYHDGKPVGRVAAILSHAANKKYNSKNLRFGWFESIEDFEVTETLMNAVQDWGREREMETLTGPHGFTDMDPQGMMIKGFDSLPTIAGIYNFEYYPKFMEKYGFTKDVDYHEFLTPTPAEKGIPEKLLRITERVKERSSIRILKFKNNKEVMARGEAIFNVIDEAFEENYGTTPLTRRQIEYYVKKYISYLDKEMIKVAVNSDDEVVGFMFTVPSMSKAFQKAKGRLFPFGWYHLLKAMKERDIIDFYMAGISQKYQGKGVDLLMVIEIVQMALEQGFNAAESNQELETNTKVQALWKHFNPTRNRERRIFKKNI
jgi:ribosomal protein S18 acetylase RimI-like enzyme